MEVVEYLKFLADNDHYTIKTAEFTNILKYQREDGFYLVTYCITQMSAHDSHIIGVVGSIDKESNIVVIWRYDCLHVKYDW